MGFSLIMSAVYNQNKFGIGYANTLVYPIKQDLQRFKKITENNVIIMGYNTWISLPNKPLKNRLHIVITSRIYGHLSSDNVIYMSFSRFKKYYIKNEKKQYYVIGGSEIFSLFLTNYIFDRLIINHIMPDIARPICIWLDPKLISNYKLFGYSQKYRDEDSQVSYRYLYYEFSYNLHEEYKYLNVMKKILANGNVRADRTNTGTVSIFGARCKFDIRDNIPLITTRHISFKNILEELLWFCRGETNSKILEKKGVNIWRGNTTREFLDKNGLYDYPDGEAGPIYGKQWRRSGNKGIDQLEYIVDLLKNDPYSRRILISSWVPEDLDKMCLTPCHTHAQWYVEEKDRVKYLSCQFYQRSQDTFLAMTYNVVSYTILTYILAKKCNMKPKELIYIGGDCHIYSNHIKQAEEQINRKPVPFPSLVLSDSIKNKDWCDIKYEDFNLVGYFPDKKITAIMAV